MTVTINPPMPSRRTESSRRVVRWLGPAALLALTPKCLLCGLAYAGFGAALGLGVPELCGGSPGARASWVSSLPWLGGFSGLTTLGFLATCRRARSAPNAQPNHRQPPTLFVGGNVVDGHDGDQRGENEYSKDHGRLFLRKHRHRMTWEI